MTTTTKGISDSSHRPIERPVLTRPKSGKGQRLSQTAASVAATLCIAVSLIHIKDQGGLPGSKSPGYIALGYYLLEAGGLVVAIGLLTRYARRAWLFAVGVAAGPLAGYVLSRGPGLPAYLDDRGNWSEPLGLISLAVEGTLLVLVIAVLVLNRRSEVGPERRDGGHPGRSQRQTTKMQAAF
jgi:hypothetical protein